MFDVAGLEEVGGLEDLLLWHAVLLDALLEGGDVLHQLEVRAFLGYPLHAAWLQRVDQSVQRQVDWFKFEKLSYVLGVEYRKKNCFWKDFRCHIEISWFIV